jgi:two-component system sensor histidine kinase KdpD
MSARLGVPWTALHVDSGLAVGGEARQTIEAHLEAARAFGGDTAVVAGTDIARTIVDEATARGVSMIAIGRSGLSRLGPFPRRSTVSDRVVREAGPIDVVVVRDSPDSRKDVTFAGLRRSLDSRPRQLFLSIAVFVSLIMLGIPISELVGARSVALVYLAAVICLSLVARPLAVASVAVASAVAFNFLFLPPRFTFIIHSFEDVILFIVYFIAAAVTGSLVSAARSNARMLGERDRRSSFLHECSARLFELDSEAAAAETAARLAADFARGEVVVVVVDASGKPKEFGNGVARLDEGTMSEALEAICGSYLPGRSLRPGARFRFVPARAAGKPIAVIGIGCPGAWTVADENQVLALGRILASVIERSRLARQSRDAALSLESERLARILLDSVSHELRTPLTAIIGTLSALMDRDISANPSARMEIVQAALSSADQLDRVLEDLLSASRIESGRLSLARENTDPEDLARLSLANCRSLSEGRIVTIRSEASAGSVYCDAALMTRAISNLLINSFRYSKPRGEVELTLRDEGNLLLIRVLDEGPGIPDSQAAFAFRKFSRLNETPTRGLGLGLAVCKGVVEAHGGSIGTRYDESGRFCVEIRLPRYSAWDERYEDIGDRR